MPDDNTPPEREIKTAEIIFNEFLKLHSEEDLIRFAWRARRARQQWLSDLLQAEIRDRTNR